MPVLGDRRHEVLRDRGAAVAVAEIGHRRRRHHHARGRAAFGSAPMPSVASIRTPSPIGADRLAVLVGLQHEVRPRRRWPASVATPCSPAGTSTASNITEGMLTKVPSTSSWRFEALAIVPRRGPITMHLAPACSMPSRTAFSEAESMPSADQDRHLAGLDRAVAAVLHAQRRRLVDRQRHRDARGSPRGRPRPWHRAR